MLVIEKNKKTKTAVICPIFKESSDFSAVSDIEHKVEEAVGLVEAMGQTAVFCDAVKIQKINSGLFFGKGKVEELKQKCEETDAELLVVDAKLTPVQQKNLEKALHLKVIDRTAVILEIFGQRAQTKEGRLQVELAHLSYQRGRLVRSWTHLERQRGGGGFLGGPGETQIELDRRHIDERIIKIKKELDKVKQTRRIQRTARVKVPYPTVALVGYTNAGKSTLFNYITKESVFAKDMLFATLDPTLRKVELGQGLEVILSDTVGFIADLPHELVMAFRATLEEVLEAEIILHVIDVSNPRYKEQRQDVLNVLHELGLEKIESTSRYFEVFNKIDLLQPTYTGEPIFKKDELAVSAMSGMGVDKLINTLREYFTQKNRIDTIKLAVSDGGRLAQIYRTSEVIERKEDENFIYLKVRHLSNKY